MNDRRSPRIWSGLRAAALVGGAVAIAIVLFVYDPAATRFFPPCPFRTLSGWYCPGCGSLRAAHALLHGELWRALTFNPAMVAALVLLVGAAIDESWRLASGRPLVSWRLPRAAVWAIAAALVIYGVLRNWPALAFLGPPR